MITKTILSNHEEWLKNRKNGIGGSEMDRTEEEVKKLIDGCCRIIQGALMRKEKTA